MYLCLALNFSLSCSCEGTFISFCLHTEGQRGRVGMTVTSSRPGVSQDTLDLFQFEMQSFGLTQVLVKADETIVSGWWSLL